MLNMKYCRTENVIAALREWEDNPGTDEHLHHELYELCSRIAAEAERLRRHEKAIKELKLYFTSGNNVPVERATIMAADFWKIVGDL